METRSRRRKKPPAMSLPEDLLVEILARVPYRSLCRFKCVSRAWLALCSDPDLRKRSPQALSGFFCFARDDDDNDNGYPDLRFLNLSGKGRPLVDPDLPFLSGVWGGGVRIMDCCSSLLLCFCWKSSSTEQDADYVVCNPATEQWTVLPATKQLHTKNIIRLGFDPAVPSRFTVFLLVQDPDNDYEITGVEIFSSETARWTYKQSKWGHETSVDDGEGSSSAFFNDTLHLTTRDSSVITVDTEGETWHKIQMPFSMEDTTDYGFITECQGRLYAMHMDYSNDRCELSVWVLEDYANDFWMVQHTANMEELVGDDEVCTLVAANSDRNLIIHVNGRDESLVSYNMDNRKSKVIFSFERYFHLRCYPYIPCYTEWSLKQAP